MSELVIALDMEKEKAVKLIEEMPEKAKYFKVGHKLFTSNPEVLTFISNKGKSAVLDLKYHDIPSVVGMAVEEVAKKYSPFALTLHTSGGKKMLAEAVNAACKFEKTERPLLFGVTVLTSLDINDLKSLGINVTEIKEQVMRLAGLAKECGLDGIVCSGREIESIKQSFGPDFLTLVPGLNLTDEGKKDQKRTFTIKDAVEKKADYMVVGRAVYESANPAGTVEGILKLLK